VREWPRAELIGSSRTFQRGNDSVCTDPSFTSVQSNPGSYNRKSFSAPPLSFSRTFSQSFRQEWVIPLTLASPRDASYERREIGSHIARSRARALGDNNVSHVAPFSRIAAPTITHTHTHTYTHPPPWPPSVFLRRINSYVPIRQLGFCLRFHEASRKL